MFPRSTPFCTYARPSSYRNIVVEASLCIARVPIEFWTVVHLPTAVVVAGPLRSLSFIWSNRNHIFPKPLGLLLYRFLRPLELGWKLGSPRHRWHPPKTCYCPKQVCHQGIGSLASRGVSIFPRTIVSPRGLAFRTLVMRSLARLEMVSNSCGKNS